MLKEHRRFFKSVFLMADIVLIEASWGVAYWLRFLSGVVPPTAQTLPDPRMYVLPLLAIPVIWPVIFHFRDLYRPRRTTSHRREVVELVQGSALAVLVLIAISYLVFKAEVSRVVLVSFWVISTAALVTVRVLARELLRFARRRGYNLHRVLIVGTGDLAGEIVRRIECHHELGLRVVGLLAREAAGAAIQAHGVPVVGGYNDVRVAIRERCADQVVIALPLEDQARLGVLLAAVESEMVDVKVVPDFLQFSRLRGGVEDFDGLVVVSLRSSPLLGWNSVAKRALDLVLGAIAMLLAAPVMAIVALAIKVTDRGPVFYRQERMGLDGRVFEMLKFRSMRVDAEDATGPVWARESDPRTTTIGRFLRRTSLDELPQLWNVVRGEMSLAGPRPERPALVERFRDQIPRYMLRHKIKAGMTGWAQVHGLRGNTSLERRIEYDLYYIQNWSISLDLKILWLTIWRGFVNKSAY